MVFPLLSLVTAVNCWVPPTGIVTAVGEMVTVAVVPGPEESLQAAMKKAANAAAIRARAIRARGMRARVSARRVLLVMALSMELLLRVA
jgi:hypothetical protein